MNNVKKKIRKYVLQNIILRELFFVITKRKTNIQKIDKKISNLYKQKYTGKVILNDVIVSLTTYGKRINEISYTLYSLINQSVTPYKIIVYITKEDYEKLSEKELQFKKYNVEFHITEDFKSYKKLIPAISEFPKHCIVTADDDLFYPKKWLEKLYYEHKKFTTDIICHEFIDITYDTKINCFNKWIVNPSKENSSRTYCILGGSGTLYPPNSLYSDYKKYDLIKQLAPTADDIFFYFMALLKGTTIRQVKNHWKQLRYVNVYREYGIIHEETLTQLNVGNNKNDIQFRNIMNYYNISDEKLIAYYNGNISRLI